MLIGRTRAPNTKGASRALKLLLDGDPACEANAAPLVEWATAAWDAATPSYAKEENRCEPSATDAEQARCHGDAVVAQPPAVGALGAPRCGGPGAHRIGYVQLNAAIRFANDDTADGSWERVRGPASAAVLTARRLGWRFQDGTTLYDEYADDLDMGRVAPESVRNAVARATHKCAAASAADRWGRPEFAKGIWVQPVRTALGRLRPPAKAALRRAWTGGYWSRARLADCGLADSAECEHCGAKRDDAYHRVWECSHVDEEREALTTPQMRIEAARRSRDDWAFTRGLLPNPWMTAPRARDDYEEVHVGPNMEVLAQPHVVDRDVFVDGSALWPANADARRAGWSIVMIDTAGKFVGAVYGHLPRSEADEQTPGHAEMYALRRATEMAVCPIRIYTDYREAAEGVKKGAEATTGPRSKHAAHWRSFWLAADGAGVEVVKVKGHITAEEVKDDPELEWRRTGNAWADKLAKKGARAHFTDEHWSQAWRDDKKQSETAALCTWIGTALGEWPQEARVRRKPADRAAMKERLRARREAARRVGGHRLDWSRDGWKCRYCGTTARTASGVNRVMNRPCGGHTAARIPRQAGNGAAAHILWTAEADDSQRQVGADVTWCSICGAYSSTKVYKLRGECRGPADRAALTRLRALQNLRHPVLGYRLKKPRRMCDGFMEAMAERSWERRRLYQEAMQEGAAGVHAEEGESSAATRLLLVGHSASGAGSQRAVPPRLAATPNDGDDVMMPTCTGEDYDVFGHGGGLDECGEDHQSNKYLHEGGETRQEGNQHGAAEEEDDAARPTGRATKAATPTGGDARDAGLGGGQGQGAVENETYGHARRVRRRTAGSEMRLVPNRLSSVADERCARCPEGTRPRLRDTDYHGDEPAHEGEGNAHTDTDLDPSMGSAEDLHGQTCGWELSEQYGNVTASDATAEPQRSRAGCPIGVSEPRGEALIGKAAAENDERGLDLEAAASQRSEAAAERIRALRERVLARERAAAARSCTSQNGGGVSVCIDEDWSERDSMHRARGLEETVRQERGLDPRAPVRRRITGKRPPGEGNNEADHRGVCDAAGDVEGQKTPSYGKRRRLRSKTGTSTA